MHLEELPLHPLPFELQALLLALPNLLLVGNLSTLRPNLGHHDVETCCEGGLLQLGLLSEELFAGRSRGSRHAERMLTLVHHCLRLQTLEGRTVRCRLNAQLLIDLRRSDGCGSCRLDLPFITLPLDQPHADDLQAYQGLIALQTLEELLGRTVHATARRTTASDRSVAVALDVGQRGGTHCSGQATQWRTVCRNQQRVAHGKIDDNPEPYAPLIRTEALDRADR